MYISNCSTVEHCTLKMMLKGYPTQRGVTKWLYAMSWECKCVAELGENSLNVRSVHFNNEFGERVQAEPGRGPR